MSFSALFELNFFIYTMIYIKKNNLLINIKKIINLSSKRALFSEKKIKFKIFFFFEKKNFQKKFPKKKNILKLIFFSEKSALFEPKF